jgi:carbon-monoxide dehydrogenase medium subunit
VVGNLATASPANDTITPLWALDASVSLRSLRGERSLSFEDFYLGLRKTALQPDELITAIQFPAMQSNQRGVFLKLGLRQAQAISVINVAVILTVEDDEIISDARITLGSVAPTIIRVPLAEDYLRGQKLNDSVIVEAARLTSTVPKPIDDVRGPATYRSEMIKVLTARALRQLNGQTQLEKFPQNPAMLWGTAKGTIQEALPSIVQHEADSDDTIVTSVNGTEYTINDASHKTLLDFLREDVGLTGTKEGCAEGECGACTVFLDDMAVMACMVPAPRAHQSEIVTIEGLNANGQLHPIQAAFVQTGAVQCGFCIPGFLMSGAKLLDEHPQPTDEQIAQSISGNLCRCTGYYKIIEAFHKASNENAKAVGD